MIRKTELEETLRELQEYEFLEIEFISNRKSTIDPAPQGICYYVKSEQCINPNAADKTIVMTMDFKLTENTITIKNQYTTNSANNTKKHLVVTKIIALDQISSITIV